MLVRASTKTFVSRVQKTAKKNLRLPKNSLAGSLVSRGIAVPRSSAYRVADTRQRPHRVTTDRRGAGTRLLQTLRAIDKVLSVRSSTRPCTWSRPRYLAAAIPSINASDDSPLSVTNALTSATLGTVHIGLSRDISRKTSTDGTSRRRGHTGPSRPTTTQLICPATLSCQWIRLLQHVPTATVSSCTCTYRDVTRTVRSSSRFLQT